LGELVESLNNIMLFYTKYVTGNLIYKH